jgi:hypothetical protein
VLVTARNIILRRMLNSRRCGKPPKSLEYAGEIKATGASLLVWPCPDFVAQNLHPTIWLECDSEMAGGRDAFP